MQYDDLVRDATPESIVAHLKQSGTQLAHLEHVHPGPAESVREAAYGGHRIVIRTTYHVEVDGVPIEGHFAVGNNGRVHYHAVPTVEYASAVDLVKQLIDLFPDDFPAPARGRGRPR